MKSFNSFLATSLSVVLLSCGVNRRDAGNKEALMQDAITLPTDLHPSSAENTETFSKTTEQTFHNTRVHPYSTFALDVDNASYSIMRRMLLQGTLPPAESVRIEEWINYFSYKYPLPNPPDPFSVNTELSDCPWNPDHKLFHIGLKGKEIPAADKKPSHLVFLIDVSGSMNDRDKLPLLKKAFELLLPQLNPSDKVSMVVYAGATGLVLDAEDGDNTATITEAINNLQAGGSTAGGEGIELAYRLAERHFIKNGNNRVILATDGDFNVGVSSEQELETLIVSKKEKGIYLTVLGFGSGNIKDNKMELLADKGNGNYYYIDNMTEARKVLSDQFGSTFHTIAKDVKFQIEFNPHFVKEYRLIGYDNRVLNAEDFNNDKKDAGEMGARHTVTALYEIVPAVSAKQNTNTDLPKYTSDVKGESNVLELATVKLRYKDPGRKDTLSKLISHPVIASYLPPNQCSRNFKLSAAVCQFGLLMSNSQFKAQSNFKTVLDLLSQIREEDEEGYVSEFYQLVKTAELLQRNADKNKP